MNGHWITATYYGSDLKALISGHEVANSWCQIGITVPLGTHLDILISKAEV